MEFSIGADKEFYFLEMNTRLQVEHPVNEGVTGLDLVRHQVRIAAGEPLGITQEQVSHHGHAIEVRIYAEDPEQNFIPSTGIITSFAKPTGPGIRIDSGVEQGDEITQFYDPMIAKLIVYGEDRAASIARLKRALEQSAIFGVATNIALLHDIATHPAFQEGLTHTGFLNEHGLLETRAGQSSALPHEALIAAALHDMQPEMPADTHMATLQVYTTNPWKMLGPWRTIGGVRTFTYRYQEQEHKVMLRPIGDSTEQWSVQVDKHPARSVSYRPGNNGLVLLKQGSAQIRVYVQHQREETQ